MNTFSELYSDSKSELSKRIGNENKIHYKRMIPKAYISI